MVSTRYTFTLDHNFYARLCVVGEHLARLPRFFTDTRKIQKRIAKNEVVVPVSSEGTEKESRASVTIDFGSPFKTPFSAPAHPNRQPIKSQSVNRKTELISG